MKTSKTIREWFNELPQEIKEKALANTPSETLATDEPSLSKALVRSFSWRISPEGGDYWSDIYDIELDKEQGRIGFLKSDIELLRLLRSKISLFNRNTGLYYKAQYVSSNNKDIERVQEILAENKPKDAVMDKYWWPINTYGNIRRWLFVTKLIWKLKSKGGLK